MAMLGLERRHKVKSWQEILSAESDNHSGNFQRCANPFCNAVIEPMNHGQWRRTERCFCGDACKYDYHTLKRVKALLDRVGVNEFYRLCNEM